MKTIIFSTLLSLLAFSSNTSAQAFKVQKADLQKCISFLMLDTRTLIIADDGTLQDALRKDAPDARCIEVVNGLGLDLSKEILVGTELTTGHCGRPPGLTANATNHDESGTLEIEIEYIEAKIPCKALIRHDLWLRVARPAPGVSVQVKIVPVKTAEDDDRRNVM